MSKKVLTPEQAEIKAMKKAQSSNRWRAFWAILLAIALVLVIFSDGRTMGEEKTAEQSSSSIADNTTSQSDNITGNNTNDNQQNSVDNSQQSQNNTQTQDTINEDEISDNPADWSKEQIVYMYKQAAAKSHPTAKSSQTMTLAEMIVNDGDGALGFFINMLTPVIESVVAKQTLEFDGITGGFNDLVPSDVDTAKAYKDGKYTVIEMRMVEQTDGLYGDPQSGTVGHAISVVGNVATAVAEFPQFDIKYEEADIKIHYADPVVKVRINENGIIEKGTWVYTAQVDIKHLQINSTMVDKAYAEIIYEIKVGGGF